MRAICVSLHEGSPFADIGGGGSREWVEEVVFFEEDVAGKRLAIPSSDNAGRIADSRKLTNDVRSFLHSWLFLGDKLLYASGFMPPRSR